MQQRFVSIWFRRLVTDWFALREPDLRQLPFVVRVSQHGRMVVAAVNAPASQLGIKNGMVLADARAIVPALQVRDELPGLAERLLRKLADWCIRFTPAAAVDLPDGIILDVTGCSHLWGGDERYLQHIAERLTARGYDVQASMADTAGAAWAAARFGSTNRVIESGRHQSLMLSMPPEALRIDVESVMRLRKLGLIKAGQLISIRPSTLRRRFGQELLDRIDQAFGKLHEVIQPVQPVEAYTERLPCLEPIVTAAGIEFALDTLLLQLCLRLRTEQKGLRTAILKCYRVDGKTQQVSIGTHKPTHHVSHLFKLFLLKIATIEPGLGIELFVLEAPRVEEFHPSQEKIWEGSGGLGDESVSELIDRLSGKVGSNAITRYLPDEHNWPERSIRPAQSVDEKASTEWPTDKQRPLQLLPVPEKIEVTAPIPDYPPMLFRHQEILHQVVKADGPERIEQEWWIQEGQHRDYYRVEDEKGRRYWLFRLGHYHDKSFQWFLHGYFA
jgi:protein ImuB